MKTKGYVAIIAAVVGIILFVAVALPVTVNVTTALNHTALGTTAATVVDLLPLMVAIGALIYVVYSVVTG